MRFFPVVGGGYSGSGDKDFFFFALVAVIVTKRGSGTFLTHGVCPRCRS